jgi:hypothetical protein
MLQSINGQLPCILNDQILWPNLSALLANEDGENILVRFAFTSHDILTYLDRTDIVKALSEKDAVSVLEKIFAKVAYSDDLANHAIVAHRFYKRYSRELIELLLRVISPNKASLLHTDDLADVCQILDYTLVPEERRRYELEFAIDGCLADPGRMIGALQTKMFLCLLQYMCKNPETYGREHLRRFIAICLNKGIDESVLADAVLSVAVGADHYSSSSRE